MKAKIFARIQRTDALLPSYSFHNPLAWEGGEKWERLPGVAAFPVERWVEDREELLYALVQEDVIALARGEMAEKLAEELSAEDEFNTIMAQENGFFVLFFVGEQIGELPDGVVVKPLPPEKIPEDLRREIEEYGFEFREDGVFCIYSPSPNRVGQMFAL